MDELTKMIMKHVNAAQLRLDAFEHKVRQISVSIKRGYNDGDPWLVTYRVGDEYGNDSAQGNELHACVQEYMRRKGWTEAHKPMVLIEAVQPQSEVIDDDDKLPF